MLVNLKKNIASIIIGLFRKTRTKSNHYQKHIQNLKNSTHSSSEIHHTKQIVLVKIIHIAVAPGSFLRYFENMISKKSRFVGFQGLKNNFLVNELVYSTISGSLTTLR